MKRIKMSAPPKSLSDSTSDKILGKLVEVEHRLKILDEKNNITNRQLRFEIASEAAKTRQELSQELNSQLVAVENRLTETFENKLKETENRINARITKVGDMIVKDLGRHIENHEKRIKKLEKLQLAA